MFFAIFLHFLACSDESDSTNKESTKVTSEKVTSEKVVDETKNETAKTVDQKNTTEEKKALPPKPKAKIGGTPILSTPIVLGGISKSHITDVMNKNDSAIQNCHEKSKKTKGKVLVKFSVNKDGTVNKPLTESTSLRDSTTEDCLNKLISGFQFDALERGSKAIVRYPVIIN